MNKQITELVHELSLIKQVDAIVLAGWIDNALKEVLLKHNAGLGFTMCFWHNLLHSKILFDREENAAKIKNKYSIPLLKELKENIIKRNYLVLKDSLPSYYHQIEKAIE